MLFPTVCEYCVHILAGFEADMHSVLLQQWTQNQSSGLL